MQYHTFGKQLLQRQRYQACQLVELQLVLTTQQGVSKYSYVNLIMNSLFDFF